MPHVLAYIMSDLELLNIDDPIFRWVSWFFYSSHPAFLESRLRRRLRYHFNLAQRPQLSRSLHSRFSFLSLDENRFSVSRQTLSASQYPPLPFVLRIRATSDILPWRDIAGAESESSFFSTDIAGMATTLPKTQMN